jgi:hypothetical protein
MQYANHFLARGEILAQEDGESAMARVAAASGTDVIAQGFVIADVVEEARPAPSATRTFASRRSNQVKRMDQDVA